MASVGILILGSYLGYLTSLMHEYRNSSQDDNKKYDFLITENQDKRTVDYLEICIESSEIADLNKDHCCNKAVDRYKATFQNMPGGVDENLEKSAYGAMKVDVATKIRTMALERAMGHSPAIDSTLEFLLSMAGGTIAVLLAIAGMIVTIVATWRLSLQQASPLEDTNSAE
ncbi:hypothetical protein [Pseudomonas fulva]|uniref:hypothetical protein n=1 Tax=Pseudomonas fulva TaxID=47880 RepID=UPI0018AC758E|nr:hypothetical protein [Pseudomonas fulva]MBF8776932.1 hypothetical protein [Pseudomonas fulva]